MFPDDHETKEKIAKFFCGLLANSLEAVFRPQRHISKAHKPLSENMMEPGEFFDRVYELLPNVRLSIVKKVFPHLAMLRDPATKKMAERSESSMSFTDFVVYLRRNVAPDRPESLDPVWHGYVVIASPSDTEFCVEFVDPLGDGRYLFVHGEEDFDAFSEGVVYHMVENELIPRLAKVHGELGEHGFPVTSIAVSTTTADDLFTKVFSLALPR